MENSTIPYYPGLTSTKTKKEKDIFRSKFELARITGLKISTLNRYLSAAEVTADSYRTIPHRNGHSHAFYNQKSQNKFFDWLCGPRDCW